MRYYSIQDDNLLTAETEQALSRFYTSVKPLPDDYAEGKYIIGEVEEEIEVPDYDEEGNPIYIDGEPSTHKESVTVKVLVLNPNWEEEQAEKERQRLDALTLTPSDVERALYYSELHIDFDDLKALISERAPQIDLKGLAIEFRANNFYRGAVDKDGNRIIDMVGLLLGYTSEDMDYLFEHKQLPVKE